MTLPEAEMHSRLVMKLAGIRERDLLPLKLAARLGNAALAARLSQGAVAHAERFSWDATVSRLLELYEGISSDG